MKRPGHPATEGLIVGVAGLVLGWVFGGSAFETVALGFIGGLLGAIIRLLEILIARQGSPDRRHARPIGGPAEPRDES